MIIVFDSSVLYAAFSSPKGFCARVIRMSREQGHVLATSDWIIDEVRRHLLSKARLQSVAVESHVELLRAAGPTVQPAMVDAAACRDPGDLPVLGTAVAAGAVALVSGDLDLLDLGSYASIVILSPRAFHDRFLAS